MSTDTTGTVVRHSVTVEASLDKAFSVFTDDIGSWWPPEHHLGQVAEMVFEPRVGGHIFDRMTDGSETHWARVLAYEPPTRLVFSWDVSPTWQLEADPSRTSEVEVRFTPEARIRPASTWSTATSIATARVGSSYGGPSTPRVGGRSGWPGSGTGWQVDPKAHSRGLDARSFAPICVR